jgi:hypothetical protein
MGDFLNGAVMMGFCVAGLCFHRFWRKSRDRFFLIFSLAFWIMGLNRFALVTWWNSGGREEKDVLAYAVRLAAFVLLLVAIWDKNRARAKA